MTYILVPVEIDAEAAQLVHPERRIIGSSGSSGCPVDPEDLDEPDELLYSVKDKIYNK